MIESVEPGDRVQLVHNNGQSSKVLIVRHVSADRTKFACVGDRPIHRCPACTCLGRTIDPTHGEWFKVGENG